MEYQKISNLLDEQGDKPKRFQTKKWIEIVDDRRGTYSTNSQIKFKTTSLMSSLCDYSEAYILVKGTISVTGAADGAGRVADVAFKNCAPFISCISEINNTQIDNAKDLDVIMPMYNMLEYSKNYSETSGSLYNFVRDTGRTGVAGEPAWVPANDTTFESKKLGATVAPAAAGDPGTLNVEIVVPLKYLSNFWRSLEIPLINTEVSLLLTWTANCVLTGTARPTTFAITDTKLYVPEVTLSIKDAENLTQQLKSGFKRSVFWNEYLSRQETVVNANANHDYLIDPSFQGVNRLFVLPFATGNARTGKGYYSPNRSVTNYNVLINGKNFLDKPVNDVSRKYDDLRHLTNGHGDDYSTGSLFDYNYVKNIYKIIALDLSKQRDLDADPRAIQQINFTANVPANTELFYVLEKAKETVFEFGQGMVKVM